MPGDVFDPRAELFVYNHCRPHWTQAGAVTFITFRTHDSIPREVLERWELRKQEWLQRRGHDANRHWSLVLPELAEKDLADFHHEFERCREDCLDTCLGRCLLRQPELAAIVAESLLHFDGKRYRMGDFVVMPNHVHLLVAFASAEIMRNQCDSWLHYTAFRINQQIGEKGKFWQQEPFDQLVRSPEHYESLRRYIAENPRKAGLNPSEYVYRRRGG